MSKITRRQFMRYSAMGTGGLIVSATIGTSLTGCSGEGLVSADFNHGVASGDPLKDRVIIWTHVTPENNDDKTVRVFWEVARDKNFDSLVVADTGLTRASQDFTLKVDLQGLKPNTVYYYRFSTINQQSIVGKTKTLPTGPVDQVKLIALSCANYPAGYFHVYSEIAKQEGVDAAIHLGDYIYEIERGGYASEDAEELGREVLPEGELLSLNDYRTRYAQYHSDPDLQAFHASLPVIAVWDDHEIADNTWREGAKGHDNTTEGEFSDRVFAAMQAYSEWMPIRPPVDADPASLYRHFKFGDLVNLIMLETRLSGRDEQLDMADYINEDGSFDEQIYQLNVNDEDRSLLGTNQLHWLKHQLHENCTWQVLGQPTLMGEMVLPGAIATLQLSVAGFANLAQIAQTDPSLLTPEQLAYLEANGHLLALPNLPYNLDAWDGYPAERARILNYVDTHQKNLIVLAGDTHNAWANNLTVDNRIVAVELATASVSSPGIERAFGLDTPEAVLQTEAGVTQLVKNTQYTNLSDRGFLTLTFTHKETRAEWTFVSSIKENNYQTLNNRANQLTVLTSNVSL